MRAIFEQRPIVPFPQPLPGKVESTIQPGQTGRVCGLGTSWFARWVSAEVVVTLEPEQPVWIVARQGITLLVTPALHELG
jgi:membrane protein implicated in regulation of membrane protease activity